MHLILEQKSLVAFFRSHALQNLCDLNETVGVQRSVVLLAESEWAPLPIGHLFSFAQFDLVDVLDHFGQSALAGTYAHFSKISLHVDEVCD